MQRDVSFDSALSIAKGFALGGAAILIILALSAIGQLVTGTM